MYRNELESIIKDKLPNCILLYGDNSFFFDYYTALYKERLDAKEDLLEHFYDEYNFEQAKGYLSQDSLFGGVNLYIVRSAKKIPKKELDYLINAVKKNSNNYFLYIYEGGSSNAKSLQSSFSKKNSAIWVRFFEPNMREASEFATKKAQELGLNITPYAINHLLNVLNLNMALITKELEKLSILQKPIEAGDIKIKSSKLLKIYQELLEAELKIKTSNSFSKESLLYGTILRIRDIL